MAAIAFDGLTKAYGDLLAVEDVSFEVDKGEIFGYLGANGAGKSTTIRVLMGFLSPTAGSAHLLGHDVTNEAALVEAKRRVGYLPDELRFDENATGREILDLHAELKGNERSGELLELFDPPVDRKIRSYSHGNVKKLGLVTAFMHDPDLVVLDEPTGGLDPLVKQRFADFVRAERDQGLTVFFLRTFSVRYADSVTGSASSEREDSSPSTPLISYSTVAARSSASSPGSHSTTRPSRDSTVSMASK